MIHCVNRFRPTTVSLLLFLGLSEATALELASPDKELVVRVELTDLGDESGCPVYSVRSRGKTVIEPSRLGMELESGALLSGFELVGQSTSSHDTTWRPVYGERSTIRDHYNELSVELRRAEGAPRRLRIVFRAYDEGVALAYDIPAQAGAGTVTIRRERTEFRFSEDHPVWAVYSAQGVYERVALTKVRKGCERPLVVEAGPDCWLAVAEARLVDSARTKLDPIGGGARGLVSALGSEVTAELPFRTPWRVVMVAKTPGGLLENNYLLLNLNDPCAIEDTSWIRPGKVIREVTLTTRGGRACVDLAVKLGLQYVEYDAGWYGPENSGESDATTVTLDPQRSKGPLDLPEVIRYAREHDIGILLYVNRRALESQLDEILPLYRSWGVKGVKYGFVQVGSQQWTSWLHDAVRKAAANRLMVDIHDEYRPTGYSRTYPNLMTQEGIGGDETRPSNEKTLAILFTRMIAGAGDNTICYYDARVSQNASHAYQLAKAVCVYSPWQFVFWYDRPAASRGEDPTSPNVIGDEPELEFFRHVPTVWDETRVIDGAIGEYAVLARRSGEEWYLGCMNAKRPRTLEVPLDFLRPDARYTAHVYRDDPAVPARTHVAIDRVPVTRDRVLRIELGEKNGQAIRIVPEAP